MKYSKLFRPSLFLFAAFIASLAHAQVITDFLPTISAPGRLDTSSTPYVLETAIGTNAVFNVTGTGPQGDSGTYGLRWTNANNFGNTQANVDLGSVVLTIPTIADTVAPGSSTAQVASFRFPKAGVYNFAVLENGVISPGDSFSILVIDVGLGNLTHAEIRTPVHNSNVSVTQSIDFTTLVDPDLLREFVMVDYYIDDIRITPAPVSAGGEGLFQYSWDKPFVGRLKVTARAQMNNGQYRDTAPIYINVQPIGSTPSATIETPGGDQWVVGSDATFSVFASDSGGVVEKIEFIVNGAVMDTITRTGARYSPRQPWTFEYRFPSNDYYDIYALVEYSTGNRARTNILQPVIGIGDRPVVRIVSPINNMRVLPGTNLPILIQSWDKNSLIEEMSYFVNDTLVETAVRGRDGNFTPDPLSFTFNFPFPGDYRIYAQATDSTGYISQSQIVTVKVENNDPTVPRVIMTHPLPVGGGDVVNDVSVGSSFYMNALATDGDGVIREVKFYINGQLVGVSTRSYQNTFSHYFSPTTSGRYSMFAEAIDNHGKNMHSTPLLLDVGPLEANHPRIEMIPFEENRREVDSGSLVTFKAKTFSGLVGISQVNFFVDGVFVDSSETGDEDGVFSVDYIIKDAGTRLISARAIQIDPNGLTYDNWVISDSLLLTVKSASGNRAFVHRIYRDFYNVEPTQAYVDTQVQSLASGQKTQAQYVYELVTTPTFLATQEVLMARIMLTGVLPNWTMLRNDLRTYASGAGLDAVVGFLLPTFQSTLWENKRLPDAFSSDADFRSCFSLLFKQKYGINPTKAQSDRAVMLMKVWGTRDFVLEFMRDNDAMILQNGTVSMLGLPNPPNSNLPDIATAAALQINLLRITPSLNDAKALSAMSLPQQIDTVLNDSRFKSRN